MQVVLQIVVQTHQKALKCSFIKLDTKHFLGEGLSTPPLPGHTRPPRPLKGGKINNSYRGRGARKTVTPFNHFAGFISTQRIAELYNVGHLTPIYGTTTFLTGLSSSKAGVLNLC